VAAVGGTETEIKLPIKDSHGIQVRLAALGFQTTKPRVFEANILYDDEAGTLRNRGCVVRLRQVGPATILTFKGRAESAKHKVREELETTVGDANTAALILERFGFIPTFQYDKYRTEYERPPEAGVVTVDETPIGWFLELEGLPDWIDRTAAELGFCEADYITVSYGTLYRSYCERIGLTPSKMVF